MTPWEIIDAALKRRRPARSQQWLADQLGFTLQRVNNWKERGVPHKCLRPVADVLGLTMDQIEGLAPLPWDRGWPFPDIEPERYYALTVREKEHVQRGLLTLIEDVEQRRTGAQSTTAPPAEGEPRPRQSEEPTEDHIRLADKRRLPDIPDNDETRKHGKG